MSEATRIDQVLRRTEWIFREPLLNVLFNLKTRASQFLPRFPPSRRVLRNFAQCQLRAGQNLVLGAGIVDLVAFAARKKPMAIEARVLCWTCSSFCGLHSLSETPMSPLKLVRLAWKRCFHRPRPRISLADDAKRIDGGEERDVKKTKVLHGVVRIDMMAHAAGAARTCSTLQNLPSLPPM